MNLKWKILIGIVVLSILGIVGIGISAYQEAQKILNGNPFLETVKVVFIALGGLGVIIPTYLNIWQSVENNSMKIDERNWNILENTMRALERWDDSSLLVARTFTRQIRKEYKDLSPNEILQKIQGDEDLEKSVILVFNYFDYLRVSIENKRVNSEIIRHELSEVFQNIAVRFKPWIDDLGKTQKEDIEKCKLLLSVKPT